MSLQAIPAKEFFEILVQKGTDVLNRFSFITFTPDGNTVYVAETIQECPPIVMRPDFPTLVTICPINSHGFLIAGASELPSAILAQFYETINQNRSFLHELQSGWRHETVLYGHRPITAYYIPFSGTDAPEVLSSDCGVNKLCTPDVDHTSATLRGVCADGRLLEAKHVFGTEDEYVIQWTERYPIPTVPGQLTGCDVFQGQPIYATSEGLFHGPEHRLIEGHVVQLFRGIKNGIHAVVDHSYGGCVYTLLGDGTTHKAVVIAERVMQMLRSASGICVQHRYNAFGVPEALAVMEYEKNRMEILPFAYSPGTWDM
jgi:hypothetical protein